MKTVKSWLKNKLLQILLPPLTQDIHKLEEEIVAGLHTSQQLFGLQYWYDANFWEPPVQIALRDLCRPGNVVFDVGANLGGLTTVMSRMVGPRGIVCAFEASPRIVDKCQRNIVLNGCNNVQIYQVAIYNSSTEKVPVYCGTYLNDSIYANNATDTAAFQVPTLALDDFVEFTNLVPDLVKMDIEGAEFDAIKGMLKTISGAKPHLILEQQPHDTRCLNLLRDKGYVAIDLNSYREIKSADDYPQDAEIRNNLYIHQDRLSEVPYQPPLTFIETAILTEEDFVVTDATGSVSSKQPIELSAGRYLIDVNFKAEGTTNEMMCGVKLEEEVIFRYHAYTNLLAKSYKDWVIDIAKTSKIKLYFSFLNDTYDKTFLVKGAKIVRVGEFDGLVSQLYI